MDVDRKIDYSSPTSCANQNTNETEKSCLKFSTDKNYKLNSLEDMNPSSKNVQHGSNLQPPRTVEVNNIPYEKSVENKQSSDGGQRTTLTNEANSINSEETQIEAKMETMPMMVDVQVNDIAYEEALVDTGNTCYITISGKLAMKLKLPQQELLRPRRVQGVSQGMDEMITHLAWAKIDIGGYQIKKAYMYVIPKQRQAMILGLRWMEEHAVTVDCDNKVLKFYRRGIEVKSSLMKPQIDCVLLKATGFDKSLAAEPMQIFAASMHDIEKALSVKAPVNPREFLPEYLLPLVEAFEPSNAATLPPHRPNIDHQMPLEIDENGREKQVPWGPLYSMSRDELLVLRKTLTELLDKRWIRQSKSPCGAPVLFAKKPGGGLRFCVDYRGLNAVTRKDRYPIPLIKETLEAVGRSRWLTKLDVSSAFHRIRIAKGEEWKTAMRTRYGTYEWLVTPFGLSGGPATFQRYINSVLQQHLDEFCTAYIDDVLIFTNESQADHREKVKLVVTKLMNAGLTIDVKKCAFEAPSVTYLGYIVEAGKGLRMDPSKIQAILDWQAPTTVKGVRGFLGFANYYRMFIPQYSKTVYPLTALTKKGVKFNWTKDCEAAFQDLKQRFMRDPILVPFNPEAPTRIEPDASKWAVGGVLMQCQNKTYEEQDDAAAVWRTVAYFSRKNSPAECNYDIHDKELLAIIRCIEDWDSELRSLANPFRILTDHKNLEAFTKIRGKPLNERQIRWQEKLSRHRFLLQFRPGSEQILADALSRRDQDVSRGKEREEVNNLKRVLISPELIVSPVQVELNSPFEDSELQNMWQSGIEHDDVYQELFESVQRGDRKMPVSITRVQISECSIGSDGLLRFRERVWVPAFEPLRTRLIQISHDSTLTGHPGRDETFRVVSRSWFWPDMLSDVRRFVRNCDICGDATIWRHKKQGLLKPLPVPDRIWNEITIDFISGLPLSNGCTTIQVITDRLSKAKSYEAVKEGELTAEATASRFVERHVRYHGFPQGIVSDRGVQWVNAFWKRVCELIGIKRRLSTAYHPETDGATERENQELERYIRCFVSYSQKDRADLLSIAELAANNRNSASTGFSPFFLTHGYNVDPVETREEVITTTNPKTPVQKAENMVSKLRDAQQMAEAAIVSAQQNQEAAANRGRAPAPEYKVGDVVRLNLRHVQTDRPCKKFDWLHSKYTVTEVIGSHAYRLDVPRGIHNVFHTCLIRPVANDPLPSQLQTDHQPPAILTSESGEEEWEVEAIQDVRKLKRGRGFRTEALVKWVGYQRPTWEPIKNVEDTVAMEEYYIRNGS